MQRNVNRLFAIFVCVGMLTGAILTVPFAAENSKAATPITLTIGMPQIVDSLNPFVGCENIAYECYQLQFDYLNRFDEHHNSVPAAAESWSHSADGKIWTFNIRHGMTFHDGVPVTAADVSWTYNLILSSPSAGSLWVSLLLNVTDVRALDDYTLQITSNAPKANMLYLTIPILPMHLWSKVPSNKLASVDLWSPTYFPNGPIGSGPFRLMEFATDSFVRFATYPGYYGGTVHFDELVYKIYMNPQVMLNDLNDGTIDIANWVPKESWQTTINQPNIDGQVVPEIFLHQMGFNVCPIDLRVGGASTNYETLNLSVRKAVAMAIDKTEILEKCVFGLGDLGSTLIASSSAAWHYNVTSQEEYKFDIAAANALLDASGYIDINGDGIRENSTNKAPLKFKYVYATEYPEDQSAAIRISRSLEQIGISAPPTGELESALFMDWIGMKYDMFMWCWGGDVDPTFMLSVMTTAQIPTSHNDWSAWSDSFYSNPYYDQLFIEQQTTIDATARQQIVFEMQRILYRDCPYVILYYPDGLYAYRTDRFTNWPVMISEGMSPMGGSRGGPFFYFEIVPISGNQPPMFDAALNPTYSPIVNTLQTFQVQVHDVNNDKLWVNWTFGDGSPVVRDIVPAGTSATPVTLTQSHTYTVLKPDPGYTMTVTLTDGILGHTDKVSTATVYVIERPDNPPSFTSLIESSPPSPVYKDTVVSWFVNASDAESGGATGFGLRFTWVWGDGKFTVSNHQPTVNNVPVMDKATHSWSVPGTYDVRVWVWDGNPNLIAHNVSSGVTPEQVIENSPPDAPYISSISGTEGIWIECVASSMDADSDALRFTWKWNDGSFNVTNQASSAGQVTSTVFHKWPVMGSLATYPVTVYVDDRTGYTGHNVSATIDASISAVGINVAPTALRIASPLPPWYINTDLKFITSAIDTDGDPLEIYFEFGDGAAGVATLPAGVTTRQYVDFTHSYATVGHYTMTLWVNDSTGPADHNSTATASIDVIANQVPWVQLPSILAAGYNRTFTVTPTQCKDNDSDPLQVWYAWGDGTPMTQGGPVASSYAASHIYSSLGNKILTVYVNDGTGLPGHNVSASATVKVFEANLKPEVVGVIEKTPSKTSYLPNEMITFTIVVKDFEGDNMTLTVEFGDGASQIVSILGATVDPANAAYSNITRNVTHAYQSKVLIQQPPSHGVARTYLVNATVKDDMDHSDTKWSIGRTSVEIIPPPIVGPKEFPFALVAGGIAIVAVIAVGAILLLKRKKKGDVPPAPKT